MIYDLNEKPPLKEWIMLSIQHVIAMFGATILVPILVNSQAGADVLSIPVALVTSGIGTLLYLICTGGKSPVYLGSSFAFIAPLGIGYVKGGVAGCMTAIMAVGLVYIFMSLLIKKIGTKFIDKYLPPVVIGPMIMIIGLSLSSSAVSQLGLAGDISINTIIGILSLIITIVILAFGRGFLRVIPFLVGIVSGYILAIMAGIIDFGVISSASFIKVPEFVIPFVHYDLNFEALFTIVPIAIVTICEHIGDHKALSNIINKDLIKDPGLDKTILGDGVATLVGGMLGGPANTTYGENTAIVGISKVSSVYVIALAGIISIWLGFIDKFTAIISTIPMEILGGISIVLYGFIAVNGLKVLVNNRIDFENSKNIIIVSVMLVIGLGGASIVIGSITMSGMSLAAIIGVILNIVLNLEGDK